MNQLSAQQSRDPAAHTFSLVIIFTLGLYLIVTSTFSFPTSLSDFDAKRVLQSGLILAIAIFTVSWKPLRQEVIGISSRLTKLNRWMIGAFFAIGVISSLRLQHPAYALVDVAMLFLLAMMLIVVAASRNLSPKLFDKWAVLLLVILGLAVFLQELMGFAAGWVLRREFNYDQALIHFAHPRFYNQLQTWTIPVIAALPLVFPGKRWIKVACVLLLGFQWFLVISLAARGTTLSLVCAALFVAFWHPGSRRHWLKLQVLGVVVGICLYFAFLFLNSLFIPPDRSGAFFAHSAGRPMMHTSGRSTLWKLSINDALNHPWLGAGPTQYACDIDSLLPAHPHSFPFQIAGEWGLIALILLVILITTFIFKLVFSYRHHTAKGQTDPPLFIMLKISLLAGLLHSCLSGLTIMPASQIALAIIGGWVLSNFLVLHSTDKPRTSLSMPILTMPLVAGMVFAFAITEVPQLTERTSHSKSAGPTMPRFWQNGRVCEYNYFSHDNTDW